MDAIDRAAEAMQKTAPVDVQFAIVHCCPNIPQGAYWGLIRNEEAKDIFPKLKENKNMLPLAINGGVVLQITPGYLETICNQYLPGVVTAEQFKRVNQEVEDSKLALFKFLQKKTKLGRFFGYLGIYCINRVNQIRIDDVDYPAFNVDLPVALAVLAQFNATVECEGVKVLAVELLRNLSNKQELARLKKSMRMSATRTGVFIRIDIPQA